MAQSSLQVVALVLLACTYDVTAQLPSGCLYISGVYECHYSFAMPLMGPAFDPPPQRLHIHNINGLLTTSNMWEWDLVNTTGFDDNFDRELTLTCIPGGGILELDFTSFENMDFYNNVEIVNCDIVSLISRSFKNFGNLNYFSLSGGHVADVQSNALGGLVIRRDPSSIQPKGELVINDVEFPNGEFPLGLVSPQLSLSILTIHKSGLNTVPLDLISLMVNLTTMSLDNNDFTSLPENMFLGVPSISNLNFEGIGWDCVCSKLWWLEYVTDNGMMVTSELLCNTPSIYQGQRVATFYSDTCLGGLQCDKGSLPAVNLGGVTCLTYLQIFIYVLAILAFIGLIIAATCWMHMRRQVAKMDGGGPMGRRSSKNKVHEHRSRAAPPGIKGGWH